MLNHSTPIQIRSDDWIELCLRNDAYNFSFLMFLFSSPWVVIMHNFLFHFSVVCEDQRGKPPH